MKKIIALMALIAIVFSSCNGRYIIAKRKYNKGFYVSKSGTTNTKPEVAHTKTTKLTAVEEKIETVVVAKEKALEITPLKTIAAPVINDQEPSLKNASRGPAIVSTSNNNYTPTSEIKPIKIHTVNTNTTKKGSDDNLILMVILCFLWFFNLIAVYMHDGGITTNFWITLLLDFTVIGGIIFSLLVVLDVVDLA